MGSKKKKKKHKKSKGKKGKSKKVRLIPKGYAETTPYLIVDDAKAALIFYKKALGASERMRMSMAGRIGHAEICFGDTVVMLADEFPEMGVKSAKSVGGTAVSVMLYVKDCDKVVARAVKLGATVLRPLEDRFYGDRVGVIVDPFGHQWMIATHLEDVSKKEMAKRMRQLTEDAKG